MRARRTAKNAAKNPGTVEVGGYFVGLFTLLALPAVAAAGALVYMALGDSGQPMGEPIAFLGLLFCAPLLPTATYRLRLSYDPDRQELSITRRHLLRTRTWRIPHDQLHCWYYAHILHMFVVLRHDEPPLRFVLHMSTTSQRWGRSPEQLTTWCRYTLGWEFEAPERAVRASRRFKRVIFLVCGVLPLAFMVGIYWALWTL